MKNNKSKLEELKRNWLSFNEFKAKYQKAEVTEYPNNVLENIPEPLVSVRITTYQHAEYIRYAIEGVLMQQTDFPFEIIIGDDESSDGTREICKEYAEKYPEKIRLFLHRRANNIKIMGKPTHLFQYTYNSFQLRGKYVAGCSGDDYWTDPLKLQKQYEFLSKNQEYSYCYHSWAQIYNGEHFTSNVNVNHTCRIITVMCKNVFDKIPPEFLKTMQEDVFLYQILALEGEKQYIDEIKPGIYRIHGKNLWDSGNELHKLQNSLNTFKQILKVFYSTKLEKELKEKIIKYSVSLLFYKLSKNRSLTPITEFLKEISNYKLYKYFPFIFKIVMLKFYNIIKAYLLKGINY